MSEWSSFASGRWSNWLAVDVFLHHAADINGERLVLVESSGYELLNQQAAEPAVTQEVVQLIGEVRHGRCGKSDAFRSARRGLAIRHLAQHRVVVVRRTELQAVYHRCVTIHGNGESGLDPFTDVGQVLVENRFYDFLELVFTVSGEELSLEAFDHGVHGGDVGYLRLFLAHNFVLLSFSTH